MNAAPLGVIGIVGVLTLGAQPAPAGKTIDVLIVVGTVKEHQTTCGQGFAIPTTVFVAGKEVWHCVNKQLLNHADEKKTPDLFKVTWVYASAGDRIHWHSHTPFRLSSVEPEGAPTPPAGPVIPNPFEEPLTKTMSSDSTFTVRHVEGNVQQRYKLRFMIGKEGFEVDPDVVCSM